MLNHIYRFHIALKDRNLHVILYSLIIILAVTLGYYRFVYITPDPYKEELLSKISDFDLERSLQNVPEKIQPGSIKVPILIYHSVRPHNSDQTAMQRYYDVSPDAFEQQLRYLKDNGYTVISLDYLVDALQDNINLPPKSIVITFDDGWRNQYAYAFPLLKKYMDTATFFIISDNVGGSLFLTWDQVRVMSNSGMTIGGHTRTHPLLVNITDPSVLQDEIAGSKTIIEGQIGRKISLFAYPYGHYSDQVVQAVKDAGYQSARSTYKGIYHTSSDMFTLKGIEVTDDMNEFIKNIQ
jgi:peptidoglycan/xylan/chitin deacetylase (PgdA/CDA1 family)